MKVAQMPEISVQEVIISKVLRRGQGLDKMDPVRIITQVFTKEGELIAEYDPFEELKNRTA